MSVRAYETIREETYGPHDSRLPLEHVVARRPRGARRRGVAAEVDQFLIVVSGGDKPRDAGDGAPC